MQHEKCATECNMKIVQHEQSRKIDIEREREREREKEREKERERERERDRERESKIWKKVQKKSAQTDNRPSVNRPLYTGAKLYSTGCTYDVIWYK